MSAYGSFAPATTNVWADNNYICYINCFTSFMAGFAVFSILGNMAWRQRSIADSSPALRVNLCDANALDLPECMAVDCSMCSTEDWMNIASSVCCGNMEVNSVAKGGVMLAFSVRTPPQRHHSSIPVAEGAFSLPVCLLQPPTAVLQE